MAITILSWNVLSGGFKDYGSTEVKPSRFNDLVKVISEISPDVVSLVDTYRWTEVFTLNELITAFKYPYVHSVKLDDERLIGIGHDNGVTVFSNISGTTFETIRIVTRNAIKTKVGGYEIFSTYLDDVSEDTRTSQINTVLKLVGSDTPTIITGDLNTIDRDDLIESDKEIGKLKDKFPGPIKSMENSLNEMRRGEVTQILKNNDFNDFGKGKGNTIPAKLFPLPINKPVLRFDYAFGNSKVKLDEFKVLTDEKYGNLSDHYPIWMRVSV